MCRPAVDSHNPSFSTQYSNSDENPRSRNNCRSSSSAKYAKNSAVIWLRLPTMRESPAKSSSSAKDFKRYSCCPIPLVYHALFRARKMPAALFSGSKSVSTRLESRSLVHVQTKRLCTQIFLSLAFTVTSLADFQSSKFTGSNSTNSAAAGSPAPNRADELVEFASPRSALAPHVHASADSRNSYAHAAAYHFPVTQTFP